MHRDGVAPEDDIDPALGHRPGEGGRGSRVHHRRPGDGDDLLPSLRTSRMRRATLATTKCLGFSEDTADPMKPNVPPVRSRSSGIARMP